MININEKAGALILINTLSVEPQNREQLIQLLQEGVEKVIKHLDGFISVSLLNSLDGTRVINFAQWKSREQAQAAFQNPQVQDYAQKINALVKNAEPVMFQVVSTHEA